MKSTLHLQFILCMLISLAHSQSMIKPYSEVFQNIAVTPKGVREPKIEGSCTTSHCKREVSSQIRNLRRSAFEFTEILSQPENCKKLLNDGSHLQNSTSQCFDDLLTWCNEYGYENGSLYTIQMLDAWGTPELGFLEGNIRWPGRYFECWNAEGEQVSGKWCNAKYGLRYNPSSVEMGYPVDAALGTCFPRSCTEEDVKYWLTYLFSIPDVPVLDRTPFEVKCPLPDTSLDTPTIIFIALLVVLGSLLLAGTFYDIHNRMMKKEIRNYKGMSSVLMSFSAIRNTEKILDTTRPSGASIPALDGIRFLSTTWVVLGHCLSMPALGFDNAIPMEKAWENWALLAIGNATVSVDTFFTLSGLLVGYLGMRQITKSRGKLPILLMYIQRYLRLTPAYAFMILFSVGFLKFFGAGPYWREYVDIQKSQCITNWWTNLLYINNVYPVENKCYGWGWYLANDMQFYLMSPFILMLLYKSLAAGVSLVSFLIVSSIICSGVISATSDQQPTAINYARFFIFPAHLAHAPGPIVQNITPEATFQNKFETDIYHTPWCRMCAYMIGMLAGVLLFKTKLKIKMSSVTVVFGWVASAASGLAIIYGVFWYTSRQEIMTIPLAAFYNAMNRAVWAACVCWVVVACTCGYGGPVTKLLDWSFWTPLSKLTYSAYLIHLIVIYWYMAVQESPMHWSYVGFVYYYLGCLMISFGLAYVLALLVEWPAMELLRIAFPRGKKDKKPEEKENSKQMEENSQVSVETASSNPPPSYVSTEKVTAKPEKNNSATNFENESFESDSTTVL